MLHGSHDVFHDYMYIMYKFIWNPFHILDPVYCAVNTLESKHDYVNKVFLDLSDIGFYWYDNLQQSLLAFGEVLCSFQNIG